jgi:multiple sugar transport system permease protein
MRTSNTIRSDLRGTLGRAVIRLVLLAGVLWAALPIAWLILTSIKSGKDILAIPPVWIPFPPQLANYEGLFTGTSSGIRLLLGPFFVNTTIIALGATALSMAVGCPAAYIFARKRMRWLRLVFFLVLASRMFPVISLAIPMYLVLNTLHLRDTRLGLILAYTSLGLPFVIWMMQAFFEDFPWELEEAALLDGCTRFGAFIRIALPLSAPGIVATVILTAIYPWNELLLSVVLTSTQSSQTVPVALTHFITSYQIAWGPLSAGATLFILPVLIFSVLVQRYLVTGMSLGAIKDK